MTPGQWAQLYIHPDDSLKSASLDQNRISPSVVISDPFVLIDGSVASHGAKDTTHSPAHWLHIICVCNDITFKECAPIRAASPRSGLAQLSTPPAGPRFTFWFRTVCCVRSVCLFERFVEWKLLFYLIYRIRYNLYSGKW